MWAAWICCCVPRPGVASAPFTALQVVTPLPVCLLHPAQPTLPYLAPAPSGTEVLVSAPMGKGFPVDSVPPADVPTLLIFATGSGGCPAPPRPA